MIPHKYYLSLSSWPRKVFYASYYISFQAFISHLTKLRCIYVFNFLSIFFWIVLSFDPAWNFNCQNIITLFRRHYQNWIHFKSFSAESRCFKVVQVISQQCNCKWELQIGGRRSFKVFLQRIRLGNNYLNRPFEPNTVKPVEQNVNFVCHKFHFIKMSVSLCAKQCQLIIQSDSNLYFQYDFHFSLI